MMTALQLRTDISTVQKFPQVIFCRQLFQRNTVILQH